MSEWLSPYRLAVLSVLDERAGSVTGLVARDVLKTQPMFGSNMRQHSGAVRSWLIILQEAGLVGLLDDQKPAAWVRTPAGTARLARSPNTSEGGEE